MITKDTLAEEIAIVGWRHGELSDVMNPFFAGDSMEMKDLEDVLYDGKVFMKPVNNKYDDNAVGVFTVDQKQLGYVWAGQATALKSWMEANNASYVVTYITKADKVAEIFLAEPKNPFHLNLRTTLDREIDVHWAENLPDRISSVEVESLSLGMSLLRDELRVAKEWTPMLQKYVNNAFMHLPVDYSSNRYMEDIEVYNMMSCSEIEEVRRHSGIMMKKLVKRGNKKQIQWWVNEWLPGLFEQAAEGDLQEMFIAAGYTLERVEELLNQAPEGLFYLYKCDKIRFGKHLLYSCLPIYIYNRLLTLLAVRELMLGKNETTNGQLIISKNDIQKAEIHKAIDQLYVEHELKKKYDFTWLLMIMNEKDDLPGFDTHESFLKYLKSIDSDWDLPSRPTITRYYNRAKGVYPNWTFDDADRNEAVRRNNVAKRFLILLHCA